MTQQRKDEKLRDSLEESMQELKREERKKVEAGKKPFFLKQKDKRELELIHKYKVLEQKGGVEKAFEKRRKKLYRKERSALPFAQRSEEPNATNESG